MVAGLIVRAISGRARSGKTSTLPGRVILFGDHAAGGVHDLNLWLNRTEAEAGCGLSFVFANPITSAWFHGLLDQKDDLPFRVRERLEYVWWLETTEVRRAGRPRRSGSRRWWTPLLDGPEIRCLPEPARQISSRPARPRWSRGRVTALGRAGTAARRPARAAGSRLGSREARGRDYRDEVRRTISDFKGAHDDDLV